MYFTELFGLPSPLEPYQAQIEKMQTGGTTGLRFHPIRYYQKSTYKLYSLYLNDKDRLLVAAKGEQLVAISVLLDHDYKKFIRSIPSLDGKVAVILADAECKLWKLKGCVLAESNESDETNKFRCYNRQVITLSSAQFNASRQPLPLVISYHFHV